MEEDINKNEAPTKKKYPFLDENGFLWISDLSKSLDEVLKWFAENYRELAKPENSHHASVTVEAVVRRVLSLNTSKEQSDAVEEAHASFALPPNIVLKIRFFISRMPIILQRGFREKLFHVIQKKVKTGQIAQKTQQLIKENIQPPLPFVQKQTENDI